MTTHTEGHKSCDAGAVSAKRVHAESIVIDAVCPLSDIPKILGDSRLRVVEHVWG
jgi:hypothetical protein